MILASSRPKFKFALPCVAPPNFQIFLLDVRRLILTPTFIYSTQDLLTRGRLHSRHAAQGVDSSNPIARAVSLTIREATSGLLELARLNIKGRLSCFHCNCAILYLEPGVRVLLLCIGKAQFCLVLLFIPYIDEVTTSRCWSLAWHRGIFN